MPKMCAWFGPDSQQRSKHLCPRTNSSQFLPFTAPKALSMRAGLTQGFDLSSSRKLGSAAATQNVTVQAILNDNVR
jgi:hypothetical protein